MRRMLFCSLLAFAVAAQVTTEDLRKGPNSNWLTYIGDYFAQRYSPLKQINASNVSHLVPSWVRHFDGPNDLETVPLVYDGVMYAINSNEVYALDAVTGREVWHYRALGAQRRAANRGVAMLGQRVFLVTGDCHLVALRRTNGAILWDQEYAPSNEGFSCTGAPLVVKDKIIVGVASSGRSCFVAALSAETGKEAWRVWAVPRKGEIGLGNLGGVPS